MKNELLLAGVLLALAMLFVGCTGPSNPGDQGIGTQGDVQQPAAGDQQQGVQNPDTQSQGGGQQAGQARGPAGDIQGRGGRGGMGPQFAQACNGKASGDVCTVTFRNQTVNGKCSDSNGNMTCSVNNTGMGPRPGAGPGAMPGGAAFIQACQGKAVGDACTLTMRNQTVDGKCAERNGNISCTPNNMNTGQRPQNRN